MTAVLLIERFTRTAPDILLYQFTVADPGTYLQPWSGEIPMRATSGPVYEYACHEGNYGMPLILSGARADERKAAGKSLRRMRSNPGILYRTAAFFICFALF